MEDLASDQVIFLEANLAGSPFQPINLVLGNSPPRLQDLFAADPTTGRWLKTLRMGRTAKLTARATDPDGDAVKFRWLVQAGSGNLSTTTGPEVVWTPPNTQGLYSVTVIAYDKKGGYARSTYPLRVDNAGVPFSGKVDATDAPAGVAGAQIEINGQLTSTGPDGNFYIHVADATRFVLNIRKTGYGLISQIYDRSTTGGQWTLAHATISSQDPTQDIDVRDGRDERNCVGALACRLNWQGFPALAQPQWQDGSNNIVSPFGKLEVPVPGLGECPGSKVCGPGIRVQIPANSLVDQNGQAPVGNVDIQLFTVDLNSPFQMPGDYTVRTSGGDTQAMESYGAGIIEITAGNRRYNLKAGATAEVTIPVDPSHLATGNPIPPTIPILFYNETQGIWVEEGNATLAGNVYVAKVPHFSAINADDIKQNQSCIRIKSPTLPNNYNLEYFVPRPGMAPKHDTVFIDNSVNKTHVIYNLPSGVNIVLVPIRLNNNTPIGTFVVNTGGPQNPTTPNQPNDPPIYAACSTEVTLTDQAIPDLPNSGEFLHGLFSFEAVNLTELTNGGPDDDPVLAAAVDQATSNYYHFVDPTGQRTNLGGFIAANGFGPGEINVVYANSADLGFGRNMHGIKNGLNTAAYVSNFGEIDTDDQTDADEAAANLNPVATVAMEYAPIEGDPSGDRVVKFFVYNNLGVRINAANLDKLGSRPVPQLCMVCHGGEYPGGPVVGSAAPFNSVDDVKLGAKYLPFDLHYYKFPASKSKASQQVAFKQFNQDIVDISPPDPVISEVITEMYAGFSQADPNVQDEDFVVSGWRDPAKPLQESMYRDVVSRTCRTCHEASPFPKLNFREASDFLTTDGEGNAKLASAEIRVGVNHVMPHSKVTHKLFWSSINPHQPAVFQLFGDTFGAGLGWSGTLLGNYTPGGTTPVTDFTTKVQPIFTSKCAVCHAGGSPPPQCKPLNLSSGSAHGAIVGITAGELPAMNRITPNNVNQSYLWFKINGTQGGLPGLNNACDPQGNAKMPIGGSLTATEINDLTSWINTGAGL
jgi:cytochrome c5